MSSSEGADEALGLQDFLVAVMGGGVRDENTESLEQEQMRYEDLLSEIHPVLLRLHTEQNVNMNLKNQYKLQYQESLSKQEILRKELASERQSKKQLEEDAARHRTDLKGQIEKLRANMHALLQDKGESSALMQQRTHEMECAMDEMKEELHTTQNSRKRLNMELKALGLEVNRMTAADYDKGKEIARLREQLADSKKEVERGLIASVNSGAKNSLLEQANTKLTTQIQELQRKLERVNYRWREKKESRNSKEAGTESFRRTITCSAA